MTLNQCQQINYRKHIIDSLVYDRGRWMSHRRWRKTLCLHWFCSNESKKKSFVYCFYVWDKNAELYYLIVKVSNSILNIVWYTFFILSIIIINSSLRVYVWSNTIRFYLTIFIVIWYYEFFLIITMYEQLIKLIKSTSLFDFEHVLINKASLILLIVFLYFLYLMSSLFIYTIFIFHLALSSLSFLIFLSLLSPLYNIAVDNW